MKTLLKRIWTDDAGVLTFEWVLLVTLVILGIVGGLSAVRDAVIDELGDVAGAVLAVDQSWTVIGCCDPCEFNFGGYEDLTANNQVTRERPAEPPVTQGP